MGIISDLMKLGSSLPGAASVASFRDYTSSGMMMAGGFEPLSRQGGENFIGPLREGASRGTTWGGFNTKWSKHGSAIPNPLGASSGSMAHKAMRIAGSTAGVAFSAYSIYSGYQENGITGAKDAAVWEVAAASGAARFAWGTAGTSGPQANMSFRKKLAQIGMKNAGTSIVMGGGAGWLPGVARMTGAGIGASVGQAVLGTPGAFIGGFIGAAPVRFAASHPLIAGGMVAGAATAAVGYGAYSVIKGGLQAGYSHRQRQKGIDTSGSMAAFMTQGAQTMRSRSVQAIHKSHLNARSALGQEAGFMHMPSKNYHSQYR
jgi:hypothetical protein